MSQQLHTKDGDTIEINARGDGPAVDVLLIRDRRLVQWAVVHCNDKPAWRSGFGWGLLAGMWVQAILTAVVLLVLG